MRREGFVCFCSNLFLPTAAFAGALKLEGLSVYSRPCRHGNRPSRERSRGHAGPGCRASVTRMGSIECRNCKRHNAPGRPRIGHFLRTTAARRRSSSMRPSSSKLTKATEGDNGCRRCRHRGREKNDGSFSTTVVRPPTEWRGVRRVTRGSSIRARRHGVLGARGTASGNDQRWRPLAPVTSPAVYHRRCDYHDPSVRPRSHARRPSLESRDAARFGFSFESRSHPSPRRAAVCYSGSRG